MKRAERRVEVSGRAQRSAELDQGTCDRDVALKPFSDPQALPSCGQGLLGAADGEQRAAERSEGVRCVQFLVQFAVERQRGFEALDGSLGAARVAYSSPKFPSTNEQVTRSPMDRASV